MSTSLNSHSPFSSRLDPGPLDRDYHRFTDEDHKRLDDDVLARLKAEIDWPRSPVGLVPLLRIICCTTKAHILQQIDHDMAGELIEKYPELGEMLNSALKHKSFKEIRCLNLLRAESGNSITGGIRSNDILYRASIKATQESWSHEFVGNAHHALKTHILHHHATLSQSYAPHCAIVQSTGTGKSKTVDEFSKSNFVIPVNLRKPGTEGFPPPDEQVHSYLFQKPDLEGSRMHAFVLALFEKCNDVIKGASGAHGKDWLHSNGAAWFRDMMTADQAIESQGPYRKKFYDDVITRAKDSDGDRPTKKLRLSSPYDTDIVDAASRLISNWDEGKHEQISTPEQLDPIVYLAFDEAHSLTQSDINGVVTEVPSPFSYLRRILRLCRNMRLFAIFLSTTGKINQSNLPREDDDSARLLRLIPPFCALGWDHGAACFPTVPIQLSYVASLAYKARLGRPLFASRYISGSQLPDLHERTRLLDQFREFAAQKLIRRDTADRPTSLTTAQELACLSARLPIEFMSSISTQAERDQVAKHMRVCLAADESFRQFTSLNPSEPILSEGAYLLMNDQHISFNAPAALSRVLHGFSVHQGDRGELVAMLILTMARDRATSSVGVAGIVPFLRALIPPPTQSNYSDIMKIKPSVYQGPDDQKITFESAFADVNLHFNHFVKRQQQDNLDEELMRRFIARCAAVMSANNQAGFVIIIPTVAGDTIEKSSQGLIIYQIKNDDTYSATVKPHLFDAMDPVAMGFISHDEKLPTPIIRMVFALAGKTPAVTHVKTQTQSNFTSYDIWISGLSPETFSVVNEADQGTWDTLLSASRGWKSVYRNRDPTTTTLLKNMNPMAANEQAFLAF